MRDYRGDGRVPRTLRSTSVYCAIPSCRAQQHRRLRRGVHGRLILEACDPGWTTRLAVGNGDSEDGNPRECLDVPSSVDEGHAPLLREGCPHWQTVRDRLREALRAEGMADLEPVLERVETAEEAERLRFIGSPTVLVDGRDPFAGAEAAFGLTCRVYRSRGSRRFADAGAASRGAPRGPERSRNELAPVAPAALGNGLDVQRRARPDALPRPPLVQVRPEQNSRALGQNSAITFEQDSSGSHPTTAAPPSSRPFRMRTSIPRPHPPHWVLPTASATSAAAIPTMS